jgi:TM2 domain-containing membrane protein YozV
MAQENLFDCENSKSFANYLFRTGQFELARHELERIGFFCKIDSSSQLNLLQSYRKLKQYNKANSFFSSKSFQELTSLNPDFRQEYIRLQMSQQYYNKVQEAIQQGFSFKEEKEHLLATNLLLGKWEIAYGQSLDIKGLESFKLNALKNIAEKSVQAKRKKPWLATMMSVVVPGSGKMYCGYWGDGVISFLFSASSGFFAYRAFTKYGSENVYPWLVGGLAFSYYSANIYGGNRAAIRYNDNLNHSFIHETEKVLYSDY